MDSVNPFSAESWPAWFYDPSLLPNSQLPFAPTSICLEMQTKFQDAPGTLRWVPWHDIKSLRHLYDPGPDIRPAWLIRWWRWSNLGNIHLHSWSHHIPKKQKHESCCEKNRKARLETLLPTFGVEGKHHSKHHFSWIRDRDDVWWCLLNLLWFNTMKSWLSDKRCV